MPKPAPGSSGVRSFWGCAQDLMMAATEEWKMEATVLYRQEPGKVKTVTAVLTETSKFKATPVKDEELRTHASRTKVAFRIRNSWMANGQFNAATTWTVEKIMLNEGKVPA